MARLKAYIGTSGYSYEHWKDGCFYPKGLPQTKWLEFYSGHFDTVELNVTFYRLPKKEAFTGWHKRVPKDFTYAIKGSRFITHIKRLQDVKDPLKLFFSRAGLLKDKLSCVLWQLPPRFKADPKRLANFIGELERYKGTRHCLEFREESWYAKKIFDLLRSANIALCIADWPEFSRSGPVTADFAYLRRHGAGATLYGGRYSKKELKDDAAFIEKSLGDKKDAYIYFNNDAHGYAPKNALELKEILKAG